MGAARGLNFPFPAFIYFNKKRKNLYTSFTNSSVVEGRFFQMWTGKANNLFFSSAYSTSLLYLVVLN